MPSSQLALADTDRRVAEDKSVAPSFMLACMLWHEVLGRLAARKAEGRAAVPALQQAIDAVFDARIGDISGRGKLGADMREIWMMQPRFERRTGSTPAQRWSSSRASAPASTSCACAPTPARSRSSWLSGGKTIRSAPTRSAARCSSRRAKQHVRRVPAGRGGERVRGERTAATAAPAAAGAADPAEEGGEAPAAKKRRRRRRRPAGDTAAPAPAEADEG
jgi:poly(A) polymerase